MEEEDEFTIIPDLGVDRSSIKAWTPRLSSNIVERVKHRDLSEPYEMHMAHIFKLGNGEYAVIIEEGCSCYVAEEAQIELFPNFKRAELSFDKWVRDERGRNRGW